MASSDSELTDEISQHLNDDQKNVFIECIQGDKSVFCTGRGGTGKSRVTESVIDYFRRSSSAEDIQVAVTASTGISAFQIRGITLHRFAGVGITENDKDAMVTLASRGKSASYWKETDILIIDEISMISGTFFDNLSYVAKNLRDCDEPFGGMRLLMFGDFLQLPPVSKSSRSMKVFESQIWNDLNLYTYELKDIMRQRDIDFTHMVSKIRVGECDKNVIDYFTSLDKEVKYEDSVEPVRLYSLRKTTDEYNTSRLSQLSGAPKTYESIDKGDARSLSQCPAPRTLSIKFGSQVMLIRNINPQAVNGSIGTVVGFRYVNEARSFQPVVKFVGHNNASFTMTVSKSLWETVAPNGSVICSRSQVPLILAWATTIHKSQGQTIPRLYVDLANVFEYGQAYVALSRCVDPSCLQVVNFSESIVRTDPDSVRYYNGLQDGATQVAHTTQVSENTALWGNQVADTQLMLGRMSIRETSESSQLDSENS